MIDIIRVDHEALAQIASRFDQQSEAIELMLYAMRGTMQPLASGGWIGQGSDAFFAEMNSDILPAVQRLTDALTQAGIVTTQLSGLMQQADEEASFSFKDGGGGTSGRMTDGGSAGGSGGIGIGGSGGIGIGGSGGVGIGIGIGGSGGIGGGGDNSYTVPDDWLDGVTDSFGGGTTGNQGDYGIPRDWLDGVRDPAGGEAGAGSAGGSGSGGGSGGGSGSGGESTNEPAESAESAPTGGGSGGGSSQMDVSDPYGQGGAENGSSFRSVGAAGEATVQSGGLTYQSLAGVNSGGGGTAPAVRAVGGGAVPTAAIEQSGSAGLPFGLAAVTPFLALLGKAAKDQVDGD